MADEQTQTPEQSFKEQFEQAQEQAAQAQPEEQQEPESPESRTLKLEDQKIPYARFREVISQRNQLQQEMRDLHQNYEKRWQEVIDRLPKEAPKEPEVDFESDPASYLRHQNEQLRSEMARAIESLKAERQQQDQESSQRAQLERQQQQLTLDEQRFAKEHPDYYDAANWYIDRRKTQLADLGYGEQEIQQVLAQDSLWLTNRAQQIGESPPEVFYRHLRASGWIPRQAKGGGGPMVGAGQSQPPTKSLGGGMKQAQDTGTPSFREMSKMDDKEFKEMFDRIMKGT